MGSFVTHQHDPANIERCLTAGYDRVILCSPKKRSLQRVKKLVPEELEESDRVRALFLEPEDLLSHLAEETPEEGDEAATGTEDQAVREQINQLWEHVLELETVQGQIAQEVAQADGGTLLVPDIRGNMERSPQFREEVSNAVHDVLRQRGTLRIENQTGVGHTVRVVNLGRSVYIPPGGISDPIDIPVGTLSTELVGYEAPRNWNVGPPNYEQRIRITQTAAPVRILDVAPLPLAPVSYYWDPFLGAFVAGP